MVIAVVGFFGLMLVLLIVMIIRDMASPFYLLVAMTPLGLTLPQGLPFREVPAIMRFTYLVAVMIACKLHGRPLGKLFAGDRLSKMMLLWATVIVAAFVHSGDYTSWAERTLAEMLSYIALFFVIRYWVRTTRRTLVLWNLIAWVALVSAAFAIVQVVVGGYTPLFHIIYPNADLPPWDGRAVSFLPMSPNAFGGFMNLLLPVSIALSATSKGRMRVFHGTVTSLGVLAVVLSGSRGAAFGLAAAFLLAAFSFTRTKRIRIVAAALTLLLLPVAAGVFAVLMPRLTHINKANSVDERYIIWGVAFNMFEHHPVLGVGMGNFRETYSPNVVHDSKGKLDVHNLYLQFLAETGVVGLAVFLAMCFHIFRKYGYLLKKLQMRSISYISSYIIIAAVLTVLVHGTVDFLFIESSEFGGAFAIILAVCANADHLIETRRAVLQKGRTRREEGAVLPQAV